MQSMSTDSPTLYDRVGGHKSLPSVVDELYRRVLSDPLLEPFFHGVDIERLKRKQTAFLTSVFDGPGDASGADLAPAHHNRGIEREHFSAFVGHLAAALEQYGVAPHDVDEAIARVALYVDDVTGRPNVDG